MREAAARGAEAPARPHVVEPVARAAEPAKDKPELEPAAQAQTPALTELPVAQEGASWPLQPEPAVRGKRSAAAILPWQTPSEPSAVSADSDTPAAEPIIPARPLESLRPVAKEATPPAAAEHPDKEAAPTDHFAELAAALQRPTTAEAARAPAIEPKPAAARATSIAASDDANLNDMAHRLEAALRRPLAPGGATSPPPRMEPRRPAPGQAGPSHAAPRAAPPHDGPRVPPRLMPEPRLASEPRLAPEPRLPAEPRLEGRSVPEPRLVIEPRPSEPSAAVDPRSAPEPRAVPEPRPAPEPRLDAEPKPDMPPEDKPAFESLEREMASLLGRPNR
jgi:hypothetical protein